MITWALYTRKSGETLWQRRGVFPDTGKGVNALVREVMSIGAAEGWQEVKVEFGVDEYEAR